MKYTTFFVPILFLFLSASLFTSCESETIEEESSLHEINQQEIRAADKGIQRPGTQGNSNTGN